MTSPIPDAAIEAGARFLCAEMSDDWREGAAYWKHVAQGFITALAAEGLVVVRADRLDAHRQRGKNALADHLCATLMTDGFCSPRNDEGRMSAPQQCVHMTKGEHRDCCARAEGLVKAIESRGCKIVWVHDRAMIKAAQEGHPTPPVLRGQRNE